MGMFDELRCEYPLPVEGALPEDLLRSLVFQTKDLDCTMDAYTITADGELVGEDYDIEDRSDPNAEGLLALAGLMTRVNKRPRPMPDFIGEIRFYTDFGPRNNCGWGTGWVEFSAYFKDGELQSVSLVELRQPPKGATP